MAVYKSSIHGIAIDMEKLRLQNAESVALGNMGTNARGDVLGKGGKILETREEVVKKFYEANPDLNPKAVVNLKNSPKDIEKNAKIEQEIRQEPIKEASSRSSKKKAINQTFNIEETVESND